MDKENSQELDALLHQFYEAQRAIDNLPESATTAEMLRAIRRRNESRQAIIRFIVNVFVDGLIEDGVKVEF